MSEQASEAAADVSSDEMGEPSSSFPENITFHFMGYQQADAESLARNLATIFRGLGKIIDLSTLDGVSVAYDYDDALANLDRGYETSFVLQRTTDVGIGVAMTPSVLRDGVLKSHVVLHGGVADMVSGEDPESLNMLIHTLAHEAAHVEITAAWEQCFPGELLRSGFPTLMDSWRGDVYMACWEEYAACRIAGSIGYDPLPGYEETFLKVFEQIDGKVGDLVSNFHGGNADPFVGPVFGAYGTLMKFACYFLGTLAAAGRKGDPGEKVANALHGSWFRPFYARLEEACDSLFGSFAGWSDKSGFEEIGNIVEEIIEDQVMRIFKRDAGYRIFIHHPLVNC